MRTKRRMVVVALLGMVSLSLSLLLTGSVRSSDIYKSIEKNLPLFETIYKEVTKQYVDQVEPERFLRAGIDGMLNTLDPYTIYIEEREERHRLQVITHGKYGGVGLLLNFRNNFVTVGEPPFLGTPAARAGIREGDRIIRVDDTPATDMDFDETARMIRGPAGSEVKLTIQREGEPKPLVFKLIREQIKLEDIRYADLIGDGIGYILLTRFSRNARPEMISAIERMKAQGMKSIILDLRSNPGGLLDAAVQISDLFLPKGTQIVSTRGRTKASMNSFKSASDPIVGDLPLVVLVNRISASASEIVAGAVQDHDRGVVLGDTTFGKGLVQTVVPLSATSALKITTAKYYTPSGRSIQRAQYSTWSDTTAADEEMKKIYTTRSGRPLHSSGGIAPDIYIPPNRVSDLVIDLRRKSQFFNFAVHFVNSKHGEKETTELDDAFLLEQFRAYLDEKGYTYSHPLENNLAALKKEASEAGYQPSFIRDIEQLESSLSHIEDEMYSRSDRDILRLLHTEIASKQFSLKRGVEINLEADPVVQKAREILANPSRYAGMLAGVR